MLVKFDNENMKHFNFVLDLALKNQGLTAINSVSSLIALFNESAKNNGQQTESDKKENKE